MHLLIRNPRGTGAAHRASLTDLEGAATLDQLRRTCRTRTQTLCDAFAELVHAGRVLKPEAGYRFA